MFEGKYYSFCNFACCQAGASSVMHDFKSQRQTTKEETQKEWHIEQTEKSSMVGPHIS